MNRSLLFRLIVPLTFLFVLSLCVHNIWEDDGFFINLSTEIFGILITVLYVEWALRQYEQKRWQSTDLRVSNRLMVLLNITISGLRSGLGFSPEIICQSTLIDGDLLTFHKEIVRVGEQVISPVIFQRVETLDQDGWKLLAKHIQNTHNELMSFFSTFQYRLEPDQIANLLDLQESLVNSLIFYTVFPDIAGVVKKNLPQTKFSSHSLQKSGNEETAKELQKAIFLVKKISDSIDMDP